MSSTATAVSVSTPAATPTVSVLPPTADLSIEPNSAQDAATGQLFRVAVRARKRDGSDARGAHVLFTPAAGSISLEVLDPDVLASGSPTIAEARIFAEPGQLGNAIIEARVAGSDSVPLRIQIPVSKPAILFDPSGSPGAVWSGSALDIYDFLSAAPDLLLNLPSTGDRGYEINPRDLPLIRFEWQDALLSHNEAVIPANGLPPTVLFTSPHSHFDASGATAKRTGTIRASYPADPNIPPRDVTVDFPSGTAKCSRDMPPTPPPPPSAPFSTQPVDVYLAVEPLSGYVTPSIRRSPPPTPPPPAPVSVRSASVGIVHVGPVVASINLLLSAPLSLGAFTPPRLPQVGELNKTLPVPFQVSLVSSTGQTCLYSPNATSIHIPGDKLKVQWATLNAEISTSPGAPGNRWQTAPIDVPVFLTPISDGPWYLDARISGYVYDDQAPILSGIGPHGLWEYRSPFRIDRDLVYRFIIQTSVGKGVSVTVSSTPYLF